MLTEYQKAPGVTRDRLYIDTMQQVYSNVSKVMVEARSGSNLLYLPLDKLIQQAAPSGAAASVVPQATPSAALPTDSGAAGAAGADARSRDSGRNRERDAR